MKSLPLASPVLQAYRRYVPILIDRESVCQTLEGKIVATQAERRSTTIRAILDAARHLFVSRGFEQTSVDQIAALAEGAKGAVYHHFASKEMIFGQVFEEMTAELP